MKDIWTGPLQVVVAMWLSVIFTLYLAPTAAKYLAADWMAAVLLVLALAAIGLSRTRLAAGIKPMAPLLALVAYVLVQGFVLGETGGLPYVRQLLSGFVPYVLFYVLFRNLSAGRARYILLAIFILPGLVHLAYMYWDIGRAIQKGDLLLHASARFGLLESVKDSPRVGRRYLSVALLHLLCGGLMLAWCFRQTAIKYWSLDPVGPLRAVAGLAGRARGICLSLPRGRGVVGRCRAGKSAACAATLATGGIGLAAGAARSSGRGRCAGLQRRQVALGGHGVQCGCGGTRRIRPLGETG